MAFLFERSLSLITIPIEPTFPAGQVALVAALADLVAEDTSLHVETDRESGQMILGGMSEFQLDQAIHILRASHGIAVKIGAPQVAYRETLKKRVETDYTHRKRMPPQFARVKIVCAPDAAGSSFESMIDGGAVPDVFVPSVEQGIASVMGSGILAGFPMTGVKVTLVDGAYHDADSSGLAFEIAARAAFREALKEGGPVLLEPIMSVEVTTPGDIVGSIMADLRRRRGEVQSQQQRGGTVVIDALVPLANTFGYVNTLRSVSQDRATYSMSFSHYQPVPPSNPEPFGPAMGMRA